MTTSFEAEKFELAAASADEVERHQPEATSSAPTGTSDAELAADFYAEICPDCGTVYQWDGVNYHRGCTGLDDGAHLHP